MSPGFELRISYSLFSVCRLRAYSFVTKTEIQGQGKKGFPGYRSEGWFEGPGGSSSSSSSGGRNRNRDRIRNSSNNSSRSSSGGSDSSSSITVSSNAEGSSEDEMQSTSSSSDPSSTPSSCAPEPADLLPATKRAELEKLYPHDWQPRLWQNKNELVLNYEDPDLVTAFNREKWWAHMGLEKEWIGFWGGLSRNSLADSGKFGSSKVGSSVDGTVTTSRDGGTASRDTSLNVALNRADTSEPSNESSDAYNREYSYLSNGGGYGGSSSSSTTTGTTTSLDKSLDLNRHPVPQSGGDAIQKIDLFIGHYFPGQGKYYNIHDVIKYWSIVYYLSKKSRIFYQKKYQIFCQKK
jgi:hypothetical protein